MDRLDGLGRCAVLGFFCLTVDFLVDLDILDASLSRFLPLRVIEHGVPCPYFLQFLTGNVWFCGVYLLPLWSDFNVWFNLLK